ncbi:Universal stress protein family protein [compost metagenome]
MKRVLIATESSRCSLEAVRRFVEMTRAGSSEVQVLSVIPARDSADRTPASHDPRQIETTNAMADDALEALDEALQELEQAGFKASAKVRIGTPAETIVEEAKTFEADLIVLGTRNHVGDPMRQSVSERVFKHATCGLLIFPFDKEPLRSAPETALAQN